MIYLTATKNSLVAKNRELLTSGSSQVNPVQFTFSSGWDDLTRTAVFQCAGASVSMLLDDTNTCTIPWETLAYPNREMRVGVYGVDGDAVVLPTIWASLGTVREGTTLGPDAKEPTPDVYQQIVAQIEAGKLKGDKGDKGDQGDPGIDGIAVETSGMWGFEIKDGHLFCAYYGAEAPDLSIKDGHLYLTL
jgi:hypothetical protein